MRTILLIALAMWAVILVALITVAPVVAQAVAWVFGGVS